ncbi:hypothetical protein H1R20_g2363, partial [Candolleomyces eurysporus]
MSRQTRSGATYSPLSGLPDAGQLVVAGRWDAEGLFQSAAATQVACDFTVEPVDGASVVFRAPTPLSDEDLSPAIAGIFDSNAPSHPLPPSTTKHSKACNNGSKRRRSSRRQAAAQAKQTSTDSISKHAAKPSTLKKHNKLHWIAAAMRVDELPHCGRGSWTGKRESKKGLGRSWTVDELRAQGFQIIPYEEGVNKVILDAEDRIFSGVFAPPEGDWHQVKAEGAECLRAARRHGLGSGTYSPKELVHRRGEFLAIPTGVSLEGGQKRPGNLFYNLRGRRIIAQSILRNRAIRRIAGFQSSIFGFISPKLFRHYCQTFDLLFKRHPELVKNFDNSVFPCASFNCGPASVAHEHYDSNNLSFGLCALTPLGNFDYKSGGHLILFNLKIAFEFPPGSTAIIPSAAVKHGNTPIQPGEERMSIAQYAAGGLFRWVAYGFQSGKDLVSSRNGQKKRDLIDKPEEARWSEGLKLYSTPATLLKDHACV